MNIAYNQARRRFLRGVMNGTAVTFALPYLECFLNSSGAALASGAPLPRCFGTWFQGNGFVPDLWEPETQGANYQMRDHLSALAPLARKINIFSGLKVNLDGHPSVVHASGTKVVTSGGITDDGSLPSLDTLVADAIGSTRRFRSIEVACNGTTESYSRRSASSINPAEPSPSALYTRIFGSGYVDPNAQEFKPDPRVMARRSVLSAFTEDRQNLLRTLGTADRIRMEEYFSSVRELENRLALALTKPAPMEACTAPSPVKEHPPGMLIDDSIANAALFGELLAHALACGQTQTFSMVFAEAGSNMRTPNSPQTFHIYTHEEVADPKLGYQPTVHWFTERCVGAFASFLKTLDDFREGDHTLLDRTVVLYQTDHGFAKQHTLTQLPLLTAGSGGGILKTGIHVRASGSPVTRVGLTLQQAFGLPIADWGTESNKTSSPFTEVMG